MPDSSDEFDRIQFHLTCSWGTTYQIPTTNAWEFCPGWGESSNRGSLLNTASHFLPIIFLCSVHKSCIQIIIRLTNVIYQKPYLGRVWSPCDKNKFLRCANIFFAQLPDIEFPPGVWFACAHHARIGQVLSNKRQIYDKFMLFSVKIRQHMLK